MIHMFNIRNVGGLDTETGTGDLNSTLPPLFAVDYLDKDGKVIVTSGTFQRYSGAERAANDRLEAERLREKQYR